MRIIHAVSAIVRHEDRVVMVRQPDDDGLYWFIPGGVMEPGELIIDALRREVREETGLTIDGDARLAFITQVDAVHEAWQTVAFVFDVTGFVGELRPDDPDRLTYDAAFVPIGEALQRLVHVIRAAMRDPLAAYLRGETAAGCVWGYRQDASRDFRLIHRTG